MTTAQEDEPDVVDVPVPRRGSFGGRPLAAETSAPVTAAAEPVRADPVPEEPIELRAGRPPRAYRTLLRYGVAPLFLLLDVLALACAAALSRGGAERIALGVLSVALIATAGLYRSRLTLSALDDAPPLAGRILAAAGLVLAAQAVTQHGHADAHLLVTAALLAAVAVLLRLFGYALVRGARTRGLVSHPTLVLGAGRVGAKVVELLHEHPQYGLRPVGFLDGDPLLPVAERQVPVLGGNDVLAQTIVEFGVRDIVVAFGALPESALVEVIRTCDRLEVEIFFVPRLFELNHTSRDMELMWGLPLVRMRRAAYRSPSWRLKRTFDAGVAALALLVLTPLLGAIALAVRLEGGRGIFFRQERVGLDGVPFRVVKFRSLKPLDDTESQTRWNVSHDQRLGPVGRFLRQTSLDELPQLWNILVGDMSIVGPRPERPHFVDQFAALYPRYTARHRVPAGLTGWSQVHGLRGDTSIEERARFDNYYIENWSLWLDIKIMCMTLPTVLRRAGG